MNSCIIRGQNQFLYKHRGEKERTFTRFIAVNCGFHAKFSTAYHTVPPQDNKGIN